MDRKEAFNEIVEAFSKKYSHLGELFAKEFLYAVASYNIQKYSNPVFRVRRHPLLFWQAGWLKSKLLTEAYNILGASNCVMMSDVTHAALRGTVEGRKFSTPFPLKKPFAICTEFGQIVGTGNVDIVQTLLNILEEGIVTVSLAKISTIYPEERIRVEEEYDVKFIDANTFTYRTNWILFAATYNKRFLVDNAFESRFVVVTPSKKLDSELVKHVHRSPPFVLSEDSVEVVRNSIKDPTSIDCMIRLPDEVYEYNLTMRQSARLLSNILCRKWWKIKTTKDEVIEMAKYMKDNADNVWKDDVDRVLDALEGSPKTIDELVELTGLNKRNIYDALYKIRAIRDFDENNNIVFRI